MTGMVMTGIVMWVGGRLIAILNWLATGFAVQIGSSPDVTVFPQVKALAGKSALVVSACYVLAVVACGIVTMVSGSMQARYGVKELVPRLVFGFVASNFAVPLCAALIEVANALTEAMVGGNGTAVFDAATMIVTHLGAALTDESTALLAVIIGVTIVFLFFTLIFTWIVRVVVLVILGGLAPIAMACYGTPWTEPAAQLWWRTLLGTLGTAILQAIAFSMGIKMFIDPELNVLTLLGMANGDVANLLLALVTLWMTVKIPGLMRRYVTRGSGNTNPAVLIMRTVATSTVARKLPIRRGA
ncbi:hypothetical protein Rhe02_09670 [Rhizocola hellebori]|uniref:Uncharacterized protein n=1 Tax=Rhizocola hellebori TaxID=1392758 RepID=A0A8J3Q451_9ACTN|nr:hypothetical protein [Rhizocola hellebori]GIH02900.1 hypothetical protein Rhe02_09670 [Rhizocola hellebori]